MAAISWSYLQNPFDNVTKRNFKRMLLMANDHFSKLAGLAQTEPFIDQVYQTALPALEEFRLAYSSVFSAKADHHMWTMELEALMDDLSANKIRHWDIAIQGKYDDRTPKYGSYMHKGRAPFQRGAYEERIAALNTFIEKLSGDPALAAIHQDVVVFQQKMRQVRDFQNNAERLEKIWSRRLENSREALAQQMHRIFAALIMHYTADLSMVETLYDLTYLRSSYKDTDEASDDQAETVAATAGTIQSSETIALLDDKMLPTDDIAIENTGMTELEVYTADHLQTNAPNRTMIVSPQQTGVFKARDFSTGQQKILVVRNNEASGGSYSIVLSRYKKDMPKTNTSQQDAS